MHINKIKSSIYLSIVVLVASVSINAATFTVTNTNNAGAGSLRQAILDANTAASDDVINFDASFNVPRTITVLSVMNINSGGALTINGPGAALLTLDGNNASRILSVINTAPATLGAVVISSLTIANGNTAVAPNGPGGGVGINNAGSGTFGVVTMTFNNVNFRNNIGGGSTNPGGAIFCNELATVNIANSTFTGNQDTLSLTFCDLNITNSEFFGNGRVGNGQVIFSGRGVSIDGSSIYNNGNGTGNLLQFVGAVNRDVTITNTTIVNNSSATGAVRFLPSGGVKTLRNVTIAGNVATFESASISGGLSIGAFGVNVGNSIIANNFNFQGGADVRDDGGLGLNSLGYNLLENIGPTVILGTTTGNLFGLDPRLDGRPLSNGGTTKNLALRQGSPAIDAGDPTTFPATDQRGITRPQDGDGVGGARSDMGAYERRTTDIVTPERSDFDGDGKTDLSVYRPSNGVWFLQRSVAGGFAIQFGNATDKIAPADYDGDGNIDVAVYRQSQGVWYIYNSSTLSVTTTQFGLAEDLPFPGDYDGDGKADIALYRPSVGTWFVLRSTGGSSITQFGAAGDIPAPGDYDGDLRNDLVVYRPSNGVWFERRSQLGDFAIQFGNSTDKIAPADYDADGRMDVGIYRASQGVWYSVNSSNGANVVTVFGLPTDIPTPGDYDGDGRADIAIYRPSNGQWWRSRTLEGLAVTQFGLTGDTPTPNAFGN